MRSLSERFVASMVDSPLYQNGVERYRAMETRDRHAVNALAGFLFAMLLFFGLLLPAFRYSGTGLERYVAAREDVQWMRAQSPPPGIAAGLEGESLLSVVSATASRANLEFNRYQPAGDGTLNLWLERVPFAPVLDWLAALEREYGISVAELAVERRDDDARVDVRLLLER